MGFLSNLGSHFGIGGHSGGKLPPGNGQWAQLANFFPNDGTGTKKDDKGQHVDIASALAAIGAMGGQQAPPAPQMPDWAPMPQPHMLSQLQGAPQLGQRQMMPPPAYMRPYLWGNQ